MTGSFRPMPRRGLGSAERSISAISVRCVTVPPSVPPDIRIMSGRRARMRSTFWYSLRPSSTAITSMMIAPAPSAARWADSALMALTTPATVICKPPPADDVLRYRSTPLPSGRVGVMTLPSSSRMRRPDSSSISRAALETPTVTSSKGASTVVGASPRVVRRYSVPCRSMRMALVVVLPQSVARMV